MIKVWGQLDRDYTSNGDVVLRPLKARVTKKDNGDYLLDLECGLEYVDYIVEGNIITANTPTGDQAFRIGNVTKSKWKLVTKCYHVYYDSKNYLIADSLVENRTCDFAIKHLNQATEPTSIFTVSSDITRLNSFRCVRNSLYEAIETIIEKWGGHLVRDNFDIQIKDEIGTDNGITVEYKKNLKDISVQENWSDVVTKLLPVGKDGLLLNYLDPSASIYLVSENQYTLPYTKTVSFSQDIERKDFPDGEEGDTQYYTALVNDLRQQGTKYLEQYSVPKVSYSLKANLDRVTDIGDTIKVIDERLGINMLTKVTGFDYDCIFEQYKEVEFGNFTQSLSNLMTSINSTVDKAMNIGLQGLSSEVGQQISTLNVEVEQVQNSTATIIRVLEDSFVTYNGQSINIYESLPSEDAEHVMRLSYNGLELSDDGGASFTVILSMLGEVDLDNLTLSGTVALDTLSLEYEGYAIENFILEEDSDTDWTWRKYTSGKVEAWGQLSIDSDDLTWSSFTTLQTAEVDITFPFAIDNAILTATMDDCPDVGWIASVLTVDENGGTATIIREGNTGDFIINIIVRGDL